MTPTRLLILKVAALLLSPLLAIFHAGPYSALLAPLMSAMLQTAVMLLEHDHNAAEKQILETRVLDHEERIEQLEQLVEQLQQLVEQLQRRRAWFRRRR